MFVAVYPETGWRFGLEYHPSPSISITKTIAAINFSTVVRYKAVIPNNVPMDAVSKITCLGFQPFASNR